MEQCLDSLQNDAHLAVMVSKKFALSYRKNTGHSFYCFGRSENIGLSLISMLVHKDFQDLERLNQIIGRLVDHGLIAKWERDYTATDEPDTKIRIELGLDQMLGSFILLGVGSGLAVLALAAEIITFKYHPRFRNRRFCRFVQIAFSPDRFVLESECGPGNRMK